MHAKVEGRDQPEEPVKDTMTAFDALTTRLLKVPMNEVAERQRLYEAESNKDSTSPQKRKKRKKLSAFEESVRESPTDTLTQG